MPWASPSAVSTESVSRCLTDGLTASRSTTTSMECLYFLSRIGGSVSCTTSPSTRARLNPSAASCAEHLRVLPLAAADHRGQHLEAGALRQRHQPVDDLLRRLPADRLAADRAVRTSGPRVQQPEVVVDLGDGADGRARVAAGRLLVDRDRRRQSLDEVHVRLVHLTQELPRVRRQRLDVPSLALGEDGVEGEARLPGPGQPGEDDERVPRQLERDVAQIVLASTANDEPVSHAGHRMCPSDSSDSPLFEHRRSAPLSFGGAMSEGRVSCQGATPGPPTSLGPFAK